MTALETYVADKERNENVKKVRSNINELGIEYIYFQFISILGVDKIYRFVLKFLPEIK